MRTTINIDEHLLKEARQVSLRTNRSVSEIIEEGVRIYLKQGKRKGTASEISLVTFGERGPLPGVDLDDSATLLGTRIATLDDIHLPLSQYGPVGRHAPGRVLCGSRHGVRLHLGNDGSRLRALPQALLGPSARSAPAVPARGRTRPPTRWYRPNAGSVLTSAGDKAVPAKARWRYAPSTFRSASR